MLSCRVSENDNSLDFDLAMSITPYFGLEPARAESILAEVKHTVSGWSKHATKGYYGEGVQVLIIKKYQPY